MRLLGFGMLEKWRFAIPRWKEVGLLGLLEAYKQIMDKTLLVFFLKARTDCVLLAFALQPLEGC